MPSEPVGRGQGHEHGEHRSTDRQLQAVEAAAHEILLGEGRAVVLERRMHRDEGWHERDELPWPFERGGQHPEEREREERDEGEQQGVLQHGRQPRAAVDHSAFRRPLRKYT